MPRKKTKRRRSRKSFSVLNALEAYVYATILSEGIAGTSPWGLITGATDISQRSVYTGSVATSETSWQGTGEISLGDIMSQPTVALDTMAANFQSNLAPMAIAAFTTSMAFRVGKRVLRRPISNINRNIMKPALGAGIKL
jgi:hypothetical protein